MAYPELQLLGRFRHTGAMAQNTFWSPPPIAAATPALPQGLLNGRQVGEAQYVVVRSPVNPATGAADDLQYVQLVLDGLDYSMVWYSARQDTSMAPPQNRLRRGSIIQLGKPFLGRNGKVAGLLDATCPKFITSVTVKAWAGAAGVTYPFTVEVWGFVYDSVDLAKRVSVYQADDVKLENYQTGATFLVKGRTITSGGDWRGSWLALPAGRQQAGGDAVPVHPLVRRARNANPSTQNQPYVPQYANSSESPAVQNPQDNLYFKLNAQQAVLAERYGIVGPAAPNATGYDLLSGWVETAAEAQKRHPEGGIPASYNGNELRFGLVAGETNVFDGLPLLPQGPQLLTNETAYPTWIDNGLSVPANAVMQGFAGKLFGSDAEGI